MNENEPRNELLDRFVRDNFGIRSGNIPSGVLRPLRIKHDPVEPDLSEPRFRPVHGVMHRIVSLYEERLGVKIRIIGLSDYVRRWCRRDCDCCLCGFLEYLFDVQSRTVYVGEWEYESRTLTLLDYADAVLRSRGVGRRRVRNIRLFRIHAYPPRSSVALNWLLTCGSPFFRDGNRYLMYHPDELRRTRYLFGSSDTKRVGGSEH